MALNLETSFATVVHRSPPRARLETGFVTLVHTDAGTPAGAETGFTPAFLDGFLLDFCYR